MANEKISAVDQKEIAGAFKKIETDRIGLGAHEKFRIMFSEFKQ